MALLKLKLQDDIKAAMRSKDAALLSTLRLAMAVIKNEEISRKFKTDLGDQQTVAVLRREIKKRQDSAALYEQVGEKDKAAQEKTEADILSHYVPAQASREQIEVAVSEALSSHPGATQKDFGGLMKNVLAKFDGNADGKLISEILKARLVG